MTEENALKWRMKRNEVAMTSLADEAVAEEIKAKWRWQSRSSGVDWGVHVLFIPSVVLEGSGPFLLMV